MQAQYYQRRIFPWYYLFRELAINKQQSLLKVIENKAFIWEKFIEHFLHLSLDFYIFFLGSSVFLPRQNR